MLQQILNRAADLLFPPTCVTCTAEIITAPDRIQLCDACRRDFIDPSRSCEYCGAGIAEGLNPAERCMHCRGTKFKFHTVIRLGHYDGPLQPAILQAKRAAGSPLAIHLGSLLAEIRAAELRSLCAEVAIPIPAHWTRRSKYGHNSADVISSQLAARLRIPLAGQLLTRTRATKPQMELKPRERLVNVRGAFAVRPHPDLAGARILLVDDVLTTGATANEASKMLLEAGAALISVAVLARTTGKS